MPPRAERVFLDACVLYPTILRECLIGAAQAGLYVPLWSGRVLEEWARATRKLGPGAEVQARAEVALLRAAMPRAEVPEAPHIAARLHLPDENDLHVLAAAIAANADAICTLNAGDFPRGVLAGEGLARRDPDGFLWELASGHADAMARVVEGVRAKAEALSGQPQDARALLKRARLPRLAKWAGAIA
jgi:predicted nucleic acid-binding protein